MNPYAYNETVRHLKLIIGVLVGFIVLQGVGLLLLGLLFYQTTPAGVIARQSFIGKIPGVLSLVRVLDRSTNVFYRGSTSPDPLPLYALQVDKKDLLKIEKALPKKPPSPAYGNLFLQDENKVWVKGTFFEDGEKYDVKVRVRGDLFNHWAYRKKSWRIKFSKDKLFHGMRQISLIIPEDRAWFGELLNVYRAEKFNLSHPPMQPIALSLNGSIPMVYVEVEHWTEEMLEKLGFGDANLYQTGGGSSYFEQWDPIATNSAYWDKYVSSGSPLDSSEEIDLLLTDLSAKKMQLLFKDEDLVRWYAHALLAGSNHVVDHNLRILFDRSRGRFVPIPWDVHLYGMGNLQDEPSNFLWKAAFADPSLKLRVHRFLWDYVTNKKNKEDDIAFVQLQRDRMERLAYRDDTKLPSNRTVSKDFDKRIAQIQGNFTIIKDQLKISEVLVHQRVADNALIFDMTAKGVADARFSEIHIPNTIDPHTVRLYRDDGDGQWSERDIYVTLSLRDTPDKEERWVLDIEGDQGHVWVEDEGMRHRFFLISGNANIFTNEDLPLEVELRNAVTDKKADIIGESIIDERSFKDLDLASLTQDDFLKKYPAFDAHGRNGIQLSGTHTFRDTVVIPSNLSLTVYPGTSIAMGEGVSLVSYAPVFLEGTQAAPIRINASSRHPWGVFGIVDAFEESVILWAEFEGGGEALINGTLFTGMVAFHDSPVRVSDTSFRGANGDDALNIKRVPANLTRLTFEDNNADCLDIDIAESGFVKDSIFKVGGEKLKRGKPNGDGIDMSFSNVEISDVVIENQGDKCISVGEKSTPHIEDTTVRGCAIGIAVKDGSVAIAHRVRFESNDVAISTYVKKPEFSSPSFEVIDSVFEGNARDVDRQNGATVTLSP
jgi:hypothetical protein